MKKNSLVAIISLLALTTSLSSCQAIGDIFKAGVWVGVVAVCFVAFLIIYFIGKSKK